MQCPDGGESHCCLCGILFDANMKRRLQDRDELPRFVSERCKPSPFLYQRLSKPDALAYTMGRGQLYLCIPCVNWKRRVETRSLRRTRLPRLQLDQLIYFLLQPGVYPEPDHRCMERLIMGARQVENPLSVVYPIPVREILSKVDADNYTACVIAWWYYNGCTEFFASGKESRRARGVFKLLEDAGLL